MLKSLGSTPNYKLLISFVYLFPNVIFNLDEVVVFKNRTHSKQSPLVFSNVHKSTILHHFFKILCTRWCHRYSEDYRFKGLRTITCKMPLLVTSDGALLDAQGNLFETCSVLKSMVEECGVSDVIPIPNVNCSTMKNIIEFNTSGKISNADDRMLDILMAADFLGYEELLDYGARIVADSLKGKSAQEIRTYFGI